MTERPINCNSDEVRAILEGRATQTHRAIKPQPTEDKIFKRQPCIVWNAPSGGGVFGDYEAFVKQAASYCPYGQVGDRLWVREAFTWVTLGEKDPWRDRAIADGSFRRMSDGSPVAVWYRADGHEIGAPWRPSILMPRWASRITLEITGIRVERVQEIQWVWRIGCTRNPK